MKGFGFALCAAAMAQAIVCTAQARLDCSDEASKTPPEAFEYLVTCDRVDGIYSCGEEAVITVRVRDEKTGVPARLGVVRVELDAFDGKVFRTEVHDLAKEGPQFKVAGTLAKPGFLRFMFHHGDEAKHVTWCVAFDPDGIPPGVDDPADFDEFWADAYAKYLKNVPFDFEMRFDPALTTLWNDVYRFSFAAPDGKTRLYGFISYPKDRSKKYPARFEVPSAGIGGWTLGPSTYQRDRTINVLLNIFPFEMPKTLKEAEAPYKAYCEALKTKYGATHYMAAGLGVSREESTLYNYFLGAKRCIEWLHSQPEVDTRRFYYWGASQGGGYGTCVVGLSGLFTRAVVSVPCLVCDLGRFGRASSGPDMLISHTSREAREVVKKTWPYLSAENFARRITCETMVTVGFCDTTCPAQGGWSIYNLIKSPRKCIIGAVNQRHGPPDPVWFGSQQWLLGESAWRETLGEQAAYVHGKSEHAETSERVPAAAAEARSGSVELRPGKVEVVIAADAPKTVKFAAEEMALLLGGCLGAEVPVVNAFTEGRTAIVLGDNKWTRAVGIDVAGMKRDAYAIVCGERIYIAGRDDPKTDVENAILNGGVWSQLYERGTLFGVYEFLERFAGVRMYFPGELGTITPRTSALRIPAGRIDDAPVYDMARRYSAFWDGDYPEELRMKRGRTPFAERVRQLYRNRYETQYVPCCHGSHAFRYMDRFGKSNPEYFALMNNKGERSLPGCKVPHHLGQLCWTSGIVDEIYNDVVSYLRGEAASTRGIPAYGKKTAAEGTSWGVNCQQRKYVDVMPQDGFTGCKCERCQAAYSKTDSRDYATELIWGTTVDFAKRLKADGVPGYVLMMAYRPYRRVPDIDIPDNVLVQVAESGPWTILNPTTFKRDNEEIMAWAKKLGHKVWLWNYACKGSTLTMPNIPQMTPNCYGKYYSSLEPWICGAFAESESDRFIYNYLNYYVFGKVCWNPKCDWKGLIAEHYRLMFGPAEAEMKSFYVTLEKKWIKEIAGRVIDTPLGPVGSPPCAYDIWTKVYSPKVIADLRALLDTAAGKVRPGSLEARRIALIRRHIFDNLVAEARKYMARIDVKVEDAWRASHPGLPNLVVDGGFDVGRIGTSHLFGRGTGSQYVGWYGNRDKELTELDTKVFRSAPSSMRIRQMSKDASKDQISGITQYLSAGNQKLKPNKRYRYSFFIKLDGVTPLRRGGGFIARVWDEKNLWFPSDKEGGSLTGTTDWIAQKFEFTSGPRTNVDYKSYLSAEIRQATGTVWIDDIRLEELD